MGITVKIASVDRTEYVDARSLSIIDELTSRVNSASFVFICNDIALAPIDGQAVLIEEGATKLFSGRILTKEEDFLNPNLLKYQVECIDHTRDLDKKLVIESYLDKTGGYIIKDIIDKYTTGFTYVNVSDGPTITRITFDYVQVSEAITKIAETCGYQWYIDYDKDIYFFLKTDYPANFQLDDDQKYYKDLIINTDISQLRNRVYVKSSKYETLDFTELFIGDGVTETWTCKYQANALPAPSATLNDVAKTVGWDGVDNSDDYHFMLNATTKILSLGGLQSTPADGDEIVITYGADEPIIIRWDDQDSIDAVKAIEGGDGIHEFCITDNNIDIKEWAIDRAKADLLQNADPVIEGTFVTNQSDIRSGQIITLSSTKRDISQDFLIYKVELIRVDVVTEYAKIPYKPAATATIGYKPAADAEIPYRAVEGSEIIYYVYQVTIATKLKGLEDLLLQLLYQSSESLKRDTTAPGIPEGLALSTGMGSITQASLAWLKATWNTNTEDDFSHYELKYKKTAYSDFGLVTTTNTSFLWTGLEQNIEYEVYIRAVDIYGNRSSWSAQQTQVTATDTDTPAQVAGAVAIALLAGIKVTWDMSSEDNIAGYAVERQESDNGTTWTGEWTERVRTDATMWLDLLLTYTKYYRYRIKAFTQTGTEGTTSTPTADSIKPNKAGTNDIVAGAITADLIAANSIYTNAIQAGAVTASRLSASYIVVTGAAADVNAGVTTISGGKITANTITVTQLNFTPVKSTDVIARINASAEGIRIDADNIYISGSTTFASGYNPTTKLGPGQAAADVNSHVTTINGGKITAYSISADRISVTSLAAINATLGTVHAGLIYGTRIQVGGGTNEDIYFEDSGIRLYDGGSNQLWFTRSGLAWLGLYFSNGIRIYTDGSFVSLNAGSYIFACKSTGTFKMPSLSSAPAGAAGDYAYKSVSPYQMMFFNGSGWEYALDGSGW